MKDEKRHLEIANKYCHTVTFYRDINDPYSLEEIDANKYQATDKKKFIVAYLKTLDLLAFRFQEDLKDKQKSKMLATELAGAKDALYSLWKTYHPETSAWGTIYTTLDRAGADLYPIEYKKIFPNSI